MSQLSSLNIPVARMEIGDQTLIIHGLQPSHLGWLYVANKEICDNLWDKYSQQEDPTIIAAQFASDFIVQSPVLAAQVIALSLGSRPDKTNWSHDLDTAIRIPFSYQVECLIKIGNLTFSRELPPKKLLAMFLQEVMKHRPPTA